MVLWTNKHAKYEAKRRGDEELLERKRATRRAHHARNADDLNACRAERAKADPEGTRARKRRYENGENGRAVKHRYESKPGPRALHAEGVRRRRARLLSRPNESVDVSVLAERQAGLCGICGDPLAVRSEVDHVMPLSRGGSHTYDNVQLAHPACNRRKGASLPEGAE